VEHNIRLPDELLRARHSRGAPDCARDAGEVARGGEVDGGDVDAVFSAGWLCMPLERGPSRVGCCAIPILACKY
jgi:hypothetical protein